MIIVSLLLNRKRLWKEKRMSAMSSMESFVCNAVPRGVVLFAIHCECILWHDYDMVYDNSSSNKWVDKWKSEIW